MTTGRINQVTLVKKRVKKRLSSLLFLVTADQEKFGPQIRKRYLFDRFSQRETYSNITFPQ